MRHAEGCRCVRCELVTLRCELSKFREENEQLRLRLQSEDAQ